jgi:beta-phosphoglucomutase
MTNNHKPHALLFDFDGVLADTEPLHWSCWRDVLAPEGIELDWRYYEQHCIGLSERDFLAALGRRVHPARTVDDLWPLYPHKKSRFAAQAAAARVIPQSTVDCLKSLNGLPFAVVTSSVRAEIEPILDKDGVLPLAAACVYGDEVPRLKPAPDPYLIAMERLGVSRAAAFEDSQAGLASARAAGCQVIQVTHPSELPDLVAALLGRNLQLNHP